MTQRGAPPTSKHGSHPTTALRQPRVPDGIYALVDAMQLPGPCPPVNGITTEAKRNELRKRNDAMLPRGQRPDPAIDRVRLRFVAHSATKCSLGPNSPPSRVVQRRIRPPRTLERNGTRT